MSLLGLLVHLLNFMAPALVVSLLLALVSPLLLRKARPHHTWPKQAAINFVACVVVLLAGLLVYGRDGKMATYALMVMVCAGSQWLAARAWRG